MGHNTAKEIKNGLLDLFNKLEPIDDEDYLRKKTLFAAVDLLREIDNATRTGCVIIDDKVEAGLSEILLCLVAWTKSVLSELATNNRPVIRSPIKAIKNRLVVFTKKHKLKNEDNQTKNDYGWFIEKIISKIPENTEPTSIDLFFDTWDGSLKELINTVFSGKVGNVWFCFLKGFSCGKPAFLKVLRSAIYKTKQV